MSLPAVILVGGLGTRLRPLTDRTRKDMLPLVDRPQLAYTFEHLRRFGVTRAIISCGYLPTQIQESFGDRYGDLRLEYRIEQSRSAPAARSASRPKGSTSRSSRSTATRCESRPLRARGLPPEATSRATILLTPVEDPSRYGLVRVHSDDGRVLSFLESHGPRRSTRT